MLPNPGGLREQHQRRRWLDHRRARQPRGGGEPGRRDRRSRPNRSRDGEVGRLRRDRPKEEAERTPGPRQPRAPRRVHLRHEPRYRSEGFRRPNQSTLTNGTVDSQWAAEEKIHTLSKIRARSPRVKYTPREDE